MLKVMIIEQICLQIHIKSIEHIWKQQYIDAKSNDSWTNMFTDAYKKYWHMWKYKKMNAKSNDYWATMFTNPYKKYWKHMNIAINRC